MPQKVVARQLACLPLEENLDNLQRDVVTKYYVTRPVSLEVLLLHEVKECVNEV